MATDHSTTLARVQATLARARSGGGPPFVASGTRLPSSYPEAMGPRGRASKQAAVVSSRLARAPAWRHAVALAPKRGRGTACEFPYRDRARAHACEPVRTNACRASLVSGDGSNLLAPPREFPKPCVVFYRRRQTFAVAD
jgi:hypothetical protein